MARSSPSQPDFSAFTQDDETATDAVWPISVNGHTVTRIEPPAAVYGADDDVAFECPRCETLIYPPSATDRIADAAWVQHRFDIVSCSPGEDGLRS